MSGITDRTPIADTPARRPTGMRRRDAIRAGALKSVGLGSLAVIAALSLAAWAPLALAINVALH
jgi:hypothetical protein